MGATEALAVGTLGPGDVAAGLALSDEAGWNQTAEDWRLFLDMGEVFAVRDAAGRVVATAALLPLPPKAWISLVLVTAAWRRRGLASALMARCIAAAEARGLTAWLDATPAGAAVYGQMGFLDAGEGLLRLRRGLSPEPAAPPATEDATALLARLIDADRAVMAAARAPVLGVLAGRPGSRLYGRDGAVCLVRDGRRARHIGPVVAPSPGATLALTDHVLGHEAGSLVIDIGESQKALATHLAGRGFSVERPFRRMRRAAAPDGSRTPVASAGPEYG